MKSSNIGGQSEDSSEVFDVDGLVGGGETLSGPGTWVTTPEPSSLILLGAGLLGFALISVRRQQFASVQFFATRSPKEERLKTEN